MLHLFQELIVYIASVYLCKAQKIAKQKRVLSCNNRLSFMLVFSKIESRDVSHNNSPYLNSCLLVMTKLLVFEFKDNPQNRYK